MRGWNSGVDSVAGCHVVRQGAPRPRFHGLGGTAVSGAGCWVWSLLGRRRLWLAVASEAPQRAMFVGIDQVVTVRAS